MSQPLLQSITENDPVNPYRTRSYRYPGSIFSLDGDPADRERFEHLRDSSGATIVELGSGSGGHLIELARRDAATPCFGFELRYKRAVRTIEKAERAGARNVYVLRTDARRLEELFSPGSIRELHVNFPDPWAKPRQWKHRLLGPWLLETAMKLLAPEGVLSAKTDHEGMFEQFSRLVESEGDRWSIERRTVASDAPNPEGNIVTEFEQLFRSQGLPIYMLRLTRR